MPTQDQRFAETKVISKSEAVVSQRKAAQRAPKGRAAARAYGLLDVKLDELTQAVETFQRGSGQP